MIYFLNLVQNKKLVKKFGKRKFGEKKIFGRKKFYGQKNFRVKRILGSKKMFGSKKIFWSRIFLGPKNCWVINIYLAKNFWEKNIWG